jgi:hypothetical protein
MATIAAESRRTGAAARRSALLAVLLALGAATTDAAGSLPNLDGVWMGDGSIGMGLGTTFSLVTEVSDKGVGGYVGGMFAVSRRSLRGDLGPKAARALDWGSPWSYAGCAADSAKCRHSILHTRL